MSAEKLKKSTATVRPARLTLNELRSVIEDVKRAKEWDTLWSLLPFVPAIEAVHIITTLGDVGGWSPKADPGVFDELAPYADSCRPLSPPFKSRVQFELKLQSDGNRNILFFGTDRSWKRLLTIREGMEEPDIGFVELWNMPDGEPVWSHPLEGLAGTRTKFAVSPDVQQLVAIADDQARIIDLSDAASAEELRPTLTRDLGMGSPDELSVDFAGKILYFRDFGGRIHRVPFDPELPPVTASGGDKADPLGSDDMEDTDRQDRFIRGPAVDSRRQVLYVASATGEVVVLNSDTLEEIDRFPSTLPKGRQHDRLVVTEDGRYLLWSLSGLIRVWDIEKRLIQCDLVDTAVGGAEQDEHGLWYHARTDGATAASVFAGGKRGLVVDGKRHVRNIKPRSFSRSEEAPVEVTADVEWVSGSWSAGKNRTFGFAGTAGDSAYLFDTNETSPLIVLSGWDVRTAQVAPDDETFVLLASDGLHIMRGPTIAQLRAVVRKQEQPVVVKRDKPHDVSENLRFEVSRVDVPAGPSAFWLATSGDDLVGTEDGRVLSLSLQSPTPACEEILQLDEKITAIALSDKPSPTIAAATASGLIAVYDVALGTVVKDYHTSLAGIRSIVVLPKELYAVAWTATVGGEARVYADPFSSLAENQQPWRQQAFTQRPGSPVIASGHNGSVRLWNLDTRKLLTTLPMRANAGRETHEWQLTFTPTGYHLLYADLTNKLYFIDPRAYLIRFTSVSTYSERDVEWLEIIGAFPSAKTWSEFMLLIHRHASEGYLTASPDLELTVPRFERVVAPVLHRLPDLKEGEELHIGFDCDEPPELPEEERRAFIDAYLKGELPTSDEAPE